MRWSMMTRCCCRVRPCYNSDAMRSGVNRPMAVAGDDSRCFGRWRSWMWKRWATRGRTRRLRLTRTSSTRGSRTPGIWGRLGRVFAATMTMSLSPFRSSLLLLLVDLCCRFHSLSSSFRSLSRLLLLPLLLRRFDLLRSFRMLIPMLLPFLLLLLPLLLLLLRFLFADCEAAFGKQDNGLNKIK